MHLQIDPVGGLAGDMFVAAMLDAFPPLEPVVLSAVRAAGLPARFRCDLVAHADHALAGRRFLVLEAEAGAAHAPDSAHGHRPFSEIRSGLSVAPLDPGVRDTALAIFTLLAEAEAQVHGVTTDTVSFHELGGWDSIADIVAASAIIHSLAPATWAVGPLPLGSGLVKSAHGLLPVPAPAAALLLRGLVVRDDGVGGERVTPTGAAIARHLLSIPGKAPRERRLLGTGLGFGTRSLPGLPNCVRVLAFETQPLEAGPGDQVSSIEFEVDDQTPEDLAIGLDHLRAHPPVLDVLQIPALGKKGRVVISVRVLCRAGAEDEVAAKCFQETTTLGVRVLDIRRHTLSRSASTAVVLGHRLEGKRAFRGGHETTKVEAESLREVAGHEARERLRRAAARE
jgi:uncharacterized protein (TIGR00299 family) protein